MPCTFYGIGFVRSVLSDPIFYAIGLLYGDAVLRWMKNKLRDGAAWVVWFEKAFDKARYPMVAFAPNNVICLLAGATKMPVPAFIACNVAGTIIRLVLIRITGNVFDDQLTRRHRLPRRVQVVLRRRRHHPLPHHVEEEEGRARRAEGAPRHDREEEPRNPTQLHECPEVAASGHFWAL